MRRVMQRLVVAAAMAAGLAVASPVAAGTLPFEDPVEEPADPVCESGVQMTVYDDQGVAQVACVLSEAPPVDSASTTDTVTGGQRAGGSLPSTGRSTGAALIGLVLLALGGLCLGVARRPQVRNAFPAGRLTP